MEMLSLKALNKANPLRPQLEAQGLPGYPIIQRRLKPNTGLFISVHLNTQKKEMPPRYCDRYRSDIPKPMGLLDASASVKRSAKPILATLHVADVSILYGE